MVPSVVPYGRFTAANNSYIKYAADLLLPTVHFGTTPSESAHTRRGGFTIRPLGPGPRIGIRYYSSERHHCESQ